MPILMLTAADRLDDKASGFELKVVRDLVEL
jgi:DNA-binding response OmpR family regulator